ncbi:MAG: aminoacylase, partial [Halioglobus sp.]
GLEGIGKLEFGAQADLVMIDPDALREWDDCSNREFVYRDLFEHKQLLSRSDGVVTHTFINGEVAWCNGEYGEALGTKTLGRALRAA